MKTAFQLFAAAVMASLAIALLFGPAAAPAPERGHLVTAAAVGSSGSRAEAFYIEAVTRQPDNPDGFVDLAQYYLQQARITHDEPRFVPRAQAQLDRALSLNRDHYRARVVMGTLQNKLHQFEAAEAIARDLIGEYPGHAYNYGTLVDALVEQGRYSEAVQAMDTMLSLRPDLTSYARASYLRELMGDSEGAIRAMVMAAEAGAVGSDGRNWALQRLAMMALSEGRTGEAERIINGMVEESPADARAVAGLAHIRMVEGRLDQARALIDEAMLLSPDAGHEELAAEIYLVSGDPGAHREALRKVEAGLMAAEAMGENIRMERADFLADQGRDLALALRLAKAEVERRPGHMHANETYAWALHAAGRPSEAIAYIDHARRFGNGDAKATYRAARIYLAAGQVAAGHALLEQSLAERLHVESPSSAAAARAILASGSHSFEAS